MRGEKPKLSKVELLLTHVTKCSARVIITHSLITRFYLGKSGKDYITGRTVQACG